MILTYKIKHGRDLKLELELARQVAEFAINNRDKLSSKYVTNIGLKSIISNQILRKYGRNRQAKSISSVSLTIPSQGIKHKDNTIYISSLKLTLSFDKPCQKINQIELDETYAYVSITVQEKDQFVPEKHLGVDLNATGHCAVVAVKETGKVYKLGKKSQYIHTKYKNIRRNLQKRGLYKVVKKIKSRESHIVRDTNNKISRFIVNLAEREKANINLENLRGIRNTKKKAKSFNHTLNSWSFYQLKTMIQYKALLAGVPLALIEPAYTSKCCSRCGSIGVREGKKFECPTCGHVEHADSNAAFNISLPSPSMIRLQIDRDICKGSPDTPQKATRKSYATLEPHGL